MTICIKFSMCHHLSYHDLHQVAQWKKKIKNIIEQVSWILVYVTHLNVILYVIFSAHILLYVVQERPRNHLDMRHRLDSKGQRRGKVIDYRYHSRDLFVACRKTNFKLKLKQWRSGCHLWIRCIILSLILNGNGIELLIRISSKD